MNTYIKDRREEGFTLIELLIAIVVVGILTAVVIVGIGGLNDTGKTGACQASLDAAKAGAAVHYANTGGYPTNFNAMVTHAPRPELDLGSGVEMSTTTVANDTIAHGTDWSIVMLGGVGTANTFSVNGGVVGAGC